MTSPQSTAPRVVVMGVAGSGKSTIGALVAERLGLPFLEGDLLHSPASIAKMRAGQPLVDDDRWEWLDRISREFTTHAETGLVASCSALTWTYRRRIAADAPDIRFVHLSGPRSVLAARLAGRAGHFMPVTLLGSQLELLEPLEPDENGSTFGIEQDSSHIADQIVDYLNQTARKGHHANR